MNFLRDIIRATRLRLRIRFGTRCMAIHDLNTGYGMRCKRMRGDNKHNWCDEHLAYRLVGGKVAMFPEAYTPTPLEDFDF